MATIPSDTAPQQYALQNKLVKTAKKRRNSTTEAVSQLAKLLPLPSGTNKEKLKTNHILRLAVSYIRMKQLIQGSIMPLYGKERGKKSCNMRRTTAPLQGVSLAKKRRLHMSQSLQLPSGDVLNVSGYN
ncbi:uncharacterized protein LOC134180062 [Corticium candelabrum]|uniref:uncharacterized protein LOC134180062 n=1 Tax=Corticium candelabrum TaxID=121492 RepID=UPI002E25C875|nr:uncharacterized protein LOC134180062 [Corticium candelabrum]